MSHRFKSFLILFIASSMLFLAGCRKKNVPPLAIDLEQVNEAFLNTSGRTFREWMQNFERAVNEIYLKDDIVLLSARRPYPGKLHIFGYIERNGVFSFQRGEDELLFEIRQYKGSHRFSYELLDGYGWVYKRHYYERPSSALVTAAFISAALWHPYYTPPTRIVVIRRYRRTYRRSRRFVVRRKRYARFSRRVRVRRRTYLRRHRRKLSRFSRRRRSSKRTSRFSRRRRSFSGRSRRSGGKW